jgi:uncharacterized membrane protein YgaE (UPF0421/DUF939 family)
MKTLIGLVVAALGSVIAFRCLPRESRDRLTTAVANRMTKGMANMMASLPEDAPPKLVMSILPRLQAQNDQIIAMLRDQNELLQKRKRVAQ